MFDIWTNLAKMSNMLDRSSEELLRKALQLFLLYGYRKTTMNDIAMAGTVSRQTLYSKYENKEALYAAVIETISRQAFERGLFLGPHHRRFRRLAVRYVVEPKDHVVVKNRIGSPRQYAPEMRPVGFT